MSTVERISITLPAEMAANLRRTVKGGRRNCGVDEMSPASPIETPAGSAFFHGCAADRLGEFLQLPVKTKESRARLRLGQVQCVGKIHALLHPSQSESQAGRIIDPDRRQARQAPENLGDPRRLEAVGAAQHPLCLEQHRSLDEDVALGDGHARGASPPPQPRRPCPPRTSQVRRS